MTTFTFTKTDLYWSASIAMAAFSAIAWSQARGAPLTVAPLLALGIAFANVLVNGYFRARSEARAIEVRARIQAQPLLELKAELIRELTEGHVRVAKLQQQAASMEAAATINALDRDAVRLLFIGLNRPTSLSIWTERIFGFFSGVAASLVASTLYEIALK